MFARRLPSQTLFSANSEQRGQIQIRFRLSPYFALGFFIQGHNKGVELQILCTPRFLSAQSMSQDAGVHIVYASVLLLSEIQYVLYSASLRQFYTEEYGFLDPPPPAKVPTICVPNIACPFRLPVHANSNSIGGYTHCGTELTTTGSIRMGSLEPAGRPR